MIQRIRKALEEKEEGFTLIELLVVVIIIGILAAIAIPLFLNQRQKAYDAAIKNDLHNAALAEQSYFTDNQYYYAPTGGKIVPNDAALTPEGLSFSPATNYNSSTQQINVTVWDQNGNTVSAGGTTGTGGFCLTAESSSNHWFMYNSTAGGQSPTTYTSQPTCTYGSFTAS